MVEPLQAAHFFPVHYGSGEKNEEISSQAL
jgi:hypothetical protein